MMCARRLIILWLISFLCMGAMVSGCATQDPRPVPLEDMDAINPGKELEAQKPGAVPEPVNIQETLAPIVKGTQIDPVIYNAVFSDVALSEVLKVVLRAANLNLSVASDVDLNRRLTVHLQQATLTEALDMLVLKGAGYAWEINGDSLFINVYQERIYQFDYLDIIGETDIEIGGDMLASSVEESGVSGKFQLKAKRESKETDIWSSIQETLDLFRSTNGIVRINRSAGIIYMADRPRRINAMVNFLDSLMDALHRQVFIEAKIMEVALTKENSYGIDWTKMSVAFTDAAGRVTDTFALSINAGSSVIKATQTDFAAVMDFLETQGDVTVVSNPHLSVMNGQSAILTVGYQFPYGDVSGVDRDTETNTTTYGTSIKRAILGLQLGITPQISSDGIVIMNIVPTLTRIQGEEDVELPTGARTTETISNPIIDLQELSTTVRVREGNSIVLAGLINQVRAVEEEGLPILGSIPGLGALFKHTQEVQENKELVIYLTPYVNKVQ